MSFSFPANNKNAHILPEGYANKMSYRNLMNKINKVFSSNTKMRLIKKYAESKNPTPRAVAAKQWFHYYNNDMMSLLPILAVNNNANVRFRLASNPDVDIDTLQQLKGNKNKKVRNAAQATLDFKLRPVVWYSSHNLPKEYLYEQQKKVENMYKRHQKNSRRRLSSRAQVFPRA